MFRLVSSMKSVGRFVVASDRLAPAFSPITPLALLQLWAKHEMKKCGEGQADTAAAFWGSGLRVQGFGVGVVCVYSYFLLPHIYLFIYLFIYLCTYLCLL